jgi:hypothetical protein
MHCIARTGEVCPEHGRQLKRFKARQEEMNMTQAIANLSDNVLATAAAKHLKAAEGCGLKAILIGAVFLRLRQDNQTNRNTLFNALAAETSEASATNYLSRCRAAAMLTHFPWALDANATLDAAVDSILPQFRGYWRGGVNSIRRSGPNAPQRTRTAAAAKQENPNDVARECIKVLSSIESAVLVELVDRANAELSNRAEQAVQVAA